MNEKNTLSKSMIAVVMAFVLVLLLVVAAWQCKPSEDRAEILLPEQKTDVGYTPESNQDYEQMHRQVTPENVATVLNSLERPAYYHQVYTVLVGKEGAGQNKTVELWVNDTMIRAQITSDRQTKTILYDNEGMYIWYASNEHPVFLKHSQDRTFEDILGLPAFNYMQTIENSTTSDAEYLVLEEATGDIACVFLSLFDHNGAQLRYWVDLKNGLLYEADSMEDNEVIYLVKQIQFDRLVNGDEAFSDKFLLPDGTAAFTDETQTRQRR